MPVPNTFANATSAIPLSQLDNNFATAITIGNTAVQLGNTVTTLNNMTLANVTISSVASAITVAQGGTGLTTATAANNAIYSTGATTLTAGTLPVAAGGTGATTLTAENVVLGNGTSAVKFVAPGSSGNVLTSNGTTWVSQAAGGGGTGNVQTFTSSGTWTKPSGLNAGSRVLIQAWGAGGSGGRGTAAAGGGGGGGYAEKWVALSAMGATETITIGAGGAGVTASNTAGNAGGNTTVGSVMTAYGGGGGGGAASGSGVGQGGGGGSPYTRGGSGLLGRLGGGGGEQTSSTNMNAIVFTNRQNASSMTASRYPGDATNIWGGGAGASCYNDGCTSYSFTAGYAVYGGGGGGSNFDNDGGTSLRGGNGGAGNNSGNGTAGSAPAGGGGGSNGGTTSGAGARGEVIITVFPM